MSDAARGVDLEIGHDYIRINGVEVLVADDPIEITPISYKSCLQATITLFVRSLTVNQHLKRADAY